MVSKLSPKESPEIYQTFSKSNLSFVIRPMVESDLDKCVEFLVKANMEHNPLLLEANFKYDDYKQYARKFLESVVKDQLCLVVYDRENRKIAGFCSCCKLLNHPLLLLDTSDLEAQSSWKRYLKATKALPLKLIKATPYQKVKQAVFISGITIGSDYYSYNLASKILNFMLFEHPLMLRYSYVYMDAYCRETILLGEQFNRKIGSEMFYLIQATPIDSIMNPDQLKTFDSVNDEMGKKSHSHTTFFQTLWKKIGLRPKL